MTATTTKKRIALISTGGTIEKTYDELSGLLANQVSVLDVMLGSLELRGVEVQRVQLMNKDSLEMTPDDHTLIAETADAMARATDGVVIVHGTDRLAETGERIVALVGTPRKAVVLTGAMRPYELRATDALQNLTEALLAVQLLAPGVYASMHNQVLQFPGVIKDRQLGTFVKGPVR
jgi:L-asparaginase